MGFLLLTVIILGTGKLLQSEGLAALLGTIAGYIFARKAEEEMSARFPLDGRGRPGRPGDPAPGSGDGHNGEGSDGDGGQPGAPSQGRRLGRGRPRALRERLEAGQRETRRAVSGPQAGDGEHVRTGRRIPSPRRRP